MAPSTNRRRPSQTGKPVYSQYPGNVIPAAQISPEWLNFIKLMQPYSDASIGPVAGTTTGTLNNYVGNGSGPFNNNQWDERVDYTFSDKIHLFERFSRFTSSLDGPQMFGALGGPGLGFNNYGGISKGANDSLAAGVDISLSATLLTDFRIGYYRYNIADSKNDQDVAGAANLGFVGLNINDPVTGGLPDFNFTLLGNGGNQSIGDGLNVSRCNCPLKEREDQFQLVNNWTKIIKTHSIKIGADLRYARNLRVPSDTNRTGQLNFNGGPTSNPNAGTAGGVGFADFALGRVNQMQRYVSTSTNAKEFQKRDFFYVQDTWRATPNLTLNLGLRYEFYFPESVNGKGNGALMDLNTGYIAVAGYGNVPSNMGWNKSQFPLNPRVGIAYQFDPKTVIRGGYGRSFDIGVFGSMYGHVVTQNIPVLANQSVNAPSGNARNYAFCLGPNEPNCTQSAGQPARQHRRTDCECDAGGTGRRLPAQPRLQRQHQGTSPYAAYADGRRMEPEHPAGHHSNPVCHRRLRRQQVNPYAELGRWKHHQSGGNWTAVAGTVQRHRSATALGPEPSSRRTDGRHRS